MANLISENSKFPKTYKLLYGIGRHLLLLWYPRRNYRLAQKEIDLNWLGLKLISEMWVAVV